MERPGVLAHGAVGGVIAGAVVALWFLVVDLANGAAFMTPMVLGSAVFGGDFSYPSWGMVIAYTVLHFATFAVLGAAAAWFLATIRATPGLMMGLVFGLIVLSAFHYTGLLLGGVTAKIVLPPLHVLGSNCLAGMAFMAYLHRAYGSERPIGPAALLQYELVRQGVGVGAIGAGAVAAWFLLLDIASGRPLWTPAALGSALFFGTSDPWGVRVSVGLIAAYTVVHLAAFAVIGVAFVAGARGIARAPSRWLMALMAFVVVEGLFIGIIGAMASWVLGALGWWAILVGNLLSVGGMAWSAWFTTPELRARLWEGPVETAV